MTCTAWLVLSCITWLLVAVGFATAMGGGSGKKDCVTSCGSVDIHYPFGIGKTCSLNDDFEVNCIDGVATLARADPAKFNLSEIIFPNQLILSSTKTMAVDCRAAVGARTGLAQDLSVSNSVGISRPFNVSAQRNRFRVMGCDTSAYVSSSDPSYTSRCDTQWIRGQHFGGLGQCQLALPERSNRFAYNVTDRLDYMLHPCGMNCSFAVLAEETFKFNGTVLDGYREDKPSAPRVPITLVAEWAIQVGECGVDNKSTVCGEGATCTATLSGAKTPYHCFCEEGCEGNPYLNGTHGCCKGPDFPVVPVAIAGGFVLAGTLAAASYSGGHMAQVKYAAKLAANALKELNDQIGNPVAPDAPVDPDTVTDTSFDDGGIDAADPDVDPEIDPDDPGGDAGTQDFTKEDIDKGLKLGRKGWRLYWLLRRRMVRVAKASMTINGKQVATEIRKYTVQDRAQIQPFVTTVRFLTRLRPQQANMARLLGISTQKSSLVYRHFSDTTLHDRLHSRRGVGSQNPLSWEERLEIALGTARALVFGHAKGVYHGSLSSKMVLVDEECKCKVVEFGVVKVWRRSNLASARRGYVDPEYLDSAIKPLTSESDVYSFGVLLVELMTGQDPSAEVFNRSGSRLAMTFVSKMEADKESDDGGKRGFELMVDNRIWEEEKREQLVAIAELARRCLQKKGANRPKMVAVRNDISKWTKGPAQRTGVAPPRPLAPSRGGGPGQIVDFVALTQLSVEAESQGLGATDLV